ncbi:MAG: alanine--tRNA ligase [Desulfuromonadaceae bacterium]|nr:alanine--tRNA ligase [Desulfuromonadaceae bacterium]
MLTTNDIRARFLRYFEEHGHQIVASSSLIPHNDPTLLFTNAGMNQFKDCFLGNEKRPYARAASAQKCVRAGGKHNDLENVGRTARHHTFFEMLGNFSFGDYFKKEAIALAWKFLTDDLGLDTAHLYVTVFEDDDEAAEIWHTQEGVPRERIFRFGEADNFWSMGDTGPCGPCSEIFWDNGPGVGCGSPECAVGCDCDRYMEIWNNVFMQFDRSKDGTLTPLPKPSVDTGMGLERIAAVLQGVSSNYDTDGIRRIIDYIAELAARPYGNNQESDVSMRVVADHSRAAAFLIADGVLPSNEGRGYVLRRIMRRAMRHAKMIGFEEPVLHKTAAFVLDSMAQAYPEEAKRKAFVINVITNEEERFIQTLDKGLHILTEEITKLKHQGTSQLPGEVVFKLYDTFGFPVDLTADIVEKDGYSVDEAGFERCMEEQRRQAREHWKGSGEEGIATIYKVLAEAGITTEFSGYEKTEDFGSVVAILKDGKQIDTATKGEKVEIFTSITPFYGESGGQSGDRGSIQGEGASAKVENAVQVLPGLISHISEIDHGSISVGDNIELSIDVAARQAACLNHSATHLLQAVLGRVLGEHVQQAGSLVTPDRLRFDFTHFSALSKDEIRQIEDEVNRYIRSNREVTTKVMDTEEAVAAGAKALFGEKYTDKVRVVQMGELSMELCGGTHVSAGGDIGLFKIVQESGIAAGVRRIEALTGEKALKEVHRRQQLVDNVAALVKTDPQRLQQRIEKMVEHQKELEREIESLQDRLEADRAAKMAQNISKVGDVDLLIARLDGLDGKKLREQCDKLRDKLPTGIIVLAGAHEDKVALLVAVSKDLHGRTKAGEIIKPLAEMVGGRGGGRPDLAQAGGSEVSNIDTMLEQAPTLIEEMV